MSDVFPWERKHWASIKEEKERLAFERLNLKEKAALAPPPPEWKAYLDAVAAADAAHQKAHKAAKEALDKALQKKV